MALGQEQNRVYRELYQLSLGRKLKCAGTFNLKEASRKWIQAFPNISPAEFYAGISNGFDKMNVRIRLGEKFEDTGNVDIDIEIPGSDNIEIEIEKKKRGEKGKNLDLQRVYLEKDTQGRGLAPALARNFILLAEPMGVATVSIIPVAIGSYVAAKHGIPSSPESRE